jgi:hypothetical protein
MQLTYRWSQLSLGALRVATTLTRPASSWCVRVKCVCVGGDMSSYNVLWLMLTLAGQSSQTGCPWVACTTIGAMAEGAWSNVCCH